MAYCGPKGIPLHEFVSWPEGSQQAALAWQSREAERCPSCGTHPDDWADGSEGIHWHPMVCRGCQVRQSAEAEIEGEKTRGIKIEAARGPASRCPVCST